jgi:hypothetical protein
MGVVGSRGRGPAAPLRLPLLAWEGDGNGGGGGVSGGGGVGGKGRGRSRPELLTLLLLGELLIVRDLVMVFV